MYILTAFSQGRDGIRSIPPTQNYPVVSAVLGVSAEHRAEAIQSIITPTHVKFAVTHISIGINATITALKGWFKQEIAFVDEVLSTRLAKSSQDSVRVALPLFSTVVVVHSVVSTKSACLVT